MDMTIQQGFATTNQNFDAMISRQKRASMSKAKAAKNKKKKALSYSAWEISTQLMRSNSSGGVAQILVRARGKVQQIERYKATGEYDSAEIRAALAHAKRMVKCAQKKLRNVRAEEGMDQKCKQGGFSKNISKENEVRELLRKELQKIRKRHRNEEQGEIRAAELRYIKEKIRHQVEQQENSLQQGMSLQQDMGAMGAGEMPVEAVTAAEGMDCGGATVVDVLV
ncbi:MAG: hypothetical protein J1F02_06345 [Lachnospiraceae bacterium]|nr:hypothetical protein [Lachnospiraceae bacterium]